MSHCIRLADYIMKLARVWRACCVTCVICTATFNKGTPKFISKLGHGLSEYIRPVPQPFRVWSRRLKANSSTSDRRQMACAASPVETGWLWDAMSTTVVWLRPWALSTELWMTSGDGQGRKRAESNFSCWSFVCLEVRKITQYTYFWDGHIKENDVNGTCSMHRSLKMLTEFWSEAWRIVSTWKIEA